MSRDAVVSLARVGGIIGASIGNLLMKGPEPVMDRLHHALSSIVPLDRSLDGAIARHQVDLAYPPGSIGRLEELAAHVCRVQGANPPRKGKRRIVTFAGDHGVVAEGVTCQPQTVTAQVVREMLDDHAAICVLARRVDAQLVIVDVGVADPLEGAQGLVRRKVRPGTGNLAREPAMSEAEAVLALEVGLEQARVAAEAGVTVIGPGEMGIGNTTPASALFAAMLGLDPTVVAGKGSGLDEAGVRRKAEVIGRALALHRLDPNDPLECLTKVGGLEIAAMAGVLIGAAGHRMVPLVDGFICSAAALVACRLQPRLEDYLIFSHRSAERGHRAFVDALGVAPLLDLGLHLGEGTGSALAMHLIDDALAIYCDMATWEGGGVTREGCA